MTDNNHLSPDERPNPDNDGIDHINIYSKGRTALGRKLSNFAHIIFYHPQHGVFASVEAYWYWLGTGMKHNGLRRLYGASAKSAGIRELPVKMPDDEFRKHICDAITLKLAQNHDLALALAQSELPFRHYYAYGTPKPAVHESKKHQWQLDHILSLREIVKEGKPLLISDGTNAALMSVAPIEETVLNDDD